jgi:glutamate--cysteine ligase
MAVFLRAHREARPLTEREAEVYVASTCFKTGPPGPVGVEVERLVHDSRGPAIPVPAPTVQAAVAALPDPLPHGGRISLEPGGQVELSSRCAPDLPRLLDAVRADLRTLDTALAAAGLRPGLAAMDGHRPPRRTLDLPRYAAMQHCFDRSGPAGRTMMCSTASLQVCVDAGLDDGGRQGVAARWRRLHALAPVLVAMFANSPFSNGRPVGWASGRQAQWLRIDPSRTAAPRPAAEPRDAWTDYALDARLLCVRSPDGAWDAPRGLTMRGWLRGDGPRAATLDDLAYHLTTLFPPVRPRGFLELRVVDAQPGDGWAVATAVVTALLEDDRAADAADAACAALVGNPDAMTLAARRALAEPELATAAQACVEAALDALPRLGADLPTRSAVSRFAERYTSRARCPADDLLDHFRRTGVVDGVPRSSALGSIAPGASAPSATALGTTVLDVDAVDVPEQRRRPPT